MRRRRGIIGIVRLPIFFELASLMAVVEGEAR